MLKLMAPYTIIGAFLSYKEKKKKTKLVVPFSQTCAVIIKFNCLDYFAKFKSITNIVFLKYYFDTCRLSRKEEKTCFT